MTAATANREAERRNLGPQGEVGGGVSPWCDGGSAGDSSGRVELRAGVLDPTLGSDDGDRQRAGGTDVAEELEAGGTLLRVVTGDITAQPVDAIVNAANVHLRHGGGVAAAIARAAGPVLQRESDEWVAAHGPLRDGEAAVTSGGALPCRVVVHVAGPVHDPDRDDNADRLRAAVVAALEAAREHDARSVAFPAISAGIYGYPLDEATRVLVDTVATWVVDHPGVYDQVRFVGFDDRVADAFAGALRQR
jgi:O-acetyl-ADP-ribose deacetylase